MSCTTHCRATAHLGSSGSDYYPNSDPNTNPNPNPNPYLDPSPNPNQVGLGYLKSYEGMGRVRVECARGCSCQPVMLDGHNKAKISPYDLHYLIVQVRVWGLG